MTDAAIEVEHVHKTFAKQSAPFSSLKERVLNIGRSHEEVFEALNDVHFTVSTGETIGILGHNGSGKSTLLKCIAGTIRPTEGVVRVRGTMSALLELGAGFHPDLTGRENVFLNGSILGFTRERIEEIFDDIVDFAEIPEFIDSQIKHYSSGMVARLGFAVAVNLQPDVLLIDEVLAVGDEAFQRKCLERVRGFQREGRTILLVTHSPDMVKQICDRAVVLERGVQLFDGDPSEAVGIYRESLDRRSHGFTDPNPMESTGSVSDASPISITTVAVDDPADGVAFSPGDTVTIRTTYRCTTDQLPVRARLVIYSHDGVLMTNMSSLDITGHDLVVAKGSGEIVHEIDHLPLMDGAYSVSIALQNQTETEEYAREQDATLFSVVSGGTGTGRVALSVRLSTQSEPMAAIDQAESQETPRRVPG